MKILLFSLFLLNIIFSKDVISNFMIDGMMCDKNCPQKVVKSLNSIDGVQSCTVNFKTKIATVAYDDTKINSNKISDIISKSTYYKVIIINDKTNKTFWDWLFNS
tara:strand:- start:296 stop:610 length:315 start_codon:yes stop_codon:yes gene_type:complete